VVRWQLVGLALSFVLLGSVAYYAYTETAQLGQRSTSLEQEVTQLQAEIIQLQDNLATSQARQNLSTRQLVAEETALQLDVNELLGITSEIERIQAGNATLVTDLNNRLQNLSSAMLSVQTTVSSYLPTIFLRTYGTALASYVELPDEMRSLRLTETGPNNGVEAAIGSTPFNATIAGNSVQWEALANSVAADGNHTIWPMVLENCPNGNNAIEFEVARGVTEVAVVRDGIRNYAPVTWDPTVVHTYKIVIVQPGVQVAFYIDGVEVAVLTTGVPNVGFLLEAAEVAGTGSQAPGYATLDTFGGLLGGS
jgi:hypothetical protein